MEAVLELKRVSKVYGSGHTAVKAVDDASLIVRPGEICLIMGPSGSGKTTLISIAGCLLKPSGGEVLLNNRPVSVLDERRLPRIRLDKIGFIFQSFNLLSALTALENVQVVLSFSGLAGRASRGRAAALLAELGMADRLNHYPGQLSGGEKQRVAIARALANDPELILADEPTANLDSKTGHVVVELLNKIAKEQGKGVVIVSHDMRIMDIADRVLQLEDGRLREGAEALSRDPVCGMVVPLDRAAAVSDYKEQKFYFCSRTCKEKFDAAPTDYTME